ncbi:MAG: nucleotidyltransferase domain-containing protein [Candidatus Latescibacterota bacterium]
MTSPRTRYAPELDGAIRDVADQLGRMPEVRKVVLFGSAASGRRDLHTDLDVLVVMDSDLDFVQRNAELAGRVRCRVALDLLAYTPAEVEGMRERLFMREALAGKVLYEARAA